jgi:hypothetical protein
MSTTRFTITRNRAKISVVARIAARSWLMMATVAHRPIPFQPKTSSTSTTPPKSPAKRRPTTVVTGRSALRRMCFRITTLAGRPFDHAVLTYSCPIASTMPDRTIRRMTPRKP